MPTTVLLNKQKKNIFLKKTKMSVPYCVLEINSAVSRGAALKPHILILHANAKFGKGEKVTLSCDVPISPLHIVGNILR